MHRAAGNVGHGGSSRGADVAEANHILAPIATSPWVERLGDLLDCGRANRVITFRAPAGGRREAEVRHGAVRAGLLFQLLVASSGVWVASAPAEPATGPHETI